jgi:predicted dehydrogenase
MAKRKSLRVGVVGLGIGKAHLRGYQSHPRAKTVAVCDINQANLQAVGEEFGIDGRYTDLDEMLEREELDVVSVCTPNCLHAPQSIRALEAGCHVLVEKPMATSAREAAAMIRAAQKVDRRLMINFSYRFNQDSYALKAQVDKGLLGDVYFARTVWHRRRNVPKLGGWFGQKGQSGGGPLIDLGVHRLDLALWLMGYPQPEWVMGGTYDRLLTRIARRERAKADVEDMAVGLVRFTNGATLEIEASWASNRKENQHMETRLYGTKGGMVQFNLNATYQFSAEICTEEPGGMFTKVLVAPDVDVPSAMGHFVDCILRGRPHMAGAQDGLKVMQILDAIYKSARTGKPVHIRT